MLRIFAIEPGGWAKSVLRHDRVFQPLHSDVTLKIPQLDKLHHCKRQEILMH